MPDLQSRDMHRIQ